MFFFKSERGRLFIADIFHIAEKKPFLMRNWNKSFRVGEKWLKKVRRGRVTLNTTFFLALGTGACVAVDTLCVCLGVCVISQITTSSIGPTEH